MTAIAPIRPALASDRPADRVFRKAMRPGRIDRRPLRSRIHSDVGAARPQDGVDDRRGGRSTEQRHRLRLLPLSPRQPRRRAAGNDPCRKISVGPDRGRRRHGQSEYQPLPGLHLSPRPAGRRRLPDNGAAPALEKKGALGRLGPEIFSQAQDQMTGDEIADITARRREGARPGGDRSRFSADDGPTRPRRLRGARPPRPEQPLLRIEPRPARSRVGRT